MGLNHGTNIHVRHNPYNKNINYKRNVRIFNESDESERRK